MVMARWARDYPRVGGEESQTVGDRAQALGLPPRGRGRAWDDDNGAIAPGITPAWAGKRRPRSPPSR